VITEGTLDLNPARSPCADKVRFVVDATASVFAEPRGRRYVRLRMNLRVGTGNAASAARRSRR
jgi:hypothetical protein